MKLTPTTRTVRRLESLGYIADICERRIHTFVTKDCFGFADLVAVRPGHAVLWVQATSATNVSARLNKIKAEPRARTVLEAGCKIQVWGWRPKGDDPRIVEVTLCDLD